MGKTMKVSREQLLTMDRAISRKIELEEGMRMNHHRVHKSKKTYSRKGKNNYKLKILRDEIL